MAEKNFYFKQKNDWRNWQWNRIAERLGANKQNATCLYLAGMEDLDRAAALKRGFRSENLIGVSNDIGVVKAIRRRGGLGIHADISKLLYTWPADYPLDVLVADFLGGMSRNTHRFLNALCCCVALGAGAVVSVNLMRGRDAYSNRFREHILDCSMGEPMTAQQERLLCHRGEQFHLALLAKIWIEGGPEIARWWDVASRPITTSYRSGHLNYDSVLFSWPITTAPVGLLLHDDSIKRKLTALKATRTRISASVNA